MAASASDPVSGVLASAFSEILGAPVVTFDEYQRRKAESPGAQFQTLDIDQIFRLSYDWGTAEEEGEEEEGRELQSMVGEGGRVGGLSRQVESLSLGEIDVRVKTVNGYSHVIRVGERASVRQLKEGIREKLDMPCEEQRLTHGGRLLDDDHTSISDYGVGRDSTLHMMALTRSGMCPISFINTKEFDPTFDFDFTNVDDGDTKFYRGGRRYYRPCGWKRQAIKVKGRYKNDEWLGAPGHREESTKGEWPVSYHGTRKECSDSITSGGYLLSKCKRKRFGIGIYSTPSIEVAANKELYAHPFKADVDGKEYQLVFQNRVCPEGLKVIPASRTKVGGDYWIHKNVTLIRPYGILYKTC